MKNTSKILALVLVLMMMFAMTSMFTASAVKTTAPTMLYLTPNSNWKTDNARYAIYTWDGGDKWFDMKDTDGDGIYECEIPAGIENIIFCRMNPNAAANNWNNKWNQSSDLKYNGSNNHYIVSEGAWDKGAGTWTTFVPAQEGHECVLVEDTSKRVEPTCTTNGLKVEDCTASGCDNPHRETVLAATGHSYKDHVCSVCSTRATYTVAGTGVHLGTEWDTGNTANDMTFADGVYTKVYTNVAAGSYKLKVARDHDWGTAYPDADKAYTVATAGSTVTVTLKGETVTITVEAPHVNALVVGDTNKIVVSGATLNDFGLPVEWVPFVADENAFYSFVGDNSALAFIFTAEGALVSATGAANLEAGTYLICVGNGLVGEFNVAVTKSAWVNALAIGDNKILITDAQDNGYGFYISWVPFEVTEKANYTFTGEGLAVLVFDSAFGSVNTTELEVGTYNICVAFATPATTGVATVKVEKTAIGGEEPPVVEDPALALGDNTVVIDGTEVNLIGNAIAWYTFTPEAAGTYTFTCADLTVYIYPERNLGVSALGNGVAELEAGVLYYILVGKSGVTGEFTVNVSAGGEVLPPNTIVVGDNHYVISDALMGVGFEFIEFTVAEPGTYVVTGGAPMKVYVFTLPNVDLATAGAGAFGWNVDAMEESGFASSFEVTLPEAGTYWFGVNYEYVTTEREFDINISLKEVEEPKPEDPKPEDPKPEDPKPEDPKDEEPKDEAPEMNFFEKIIAWFMDLLQKLLAMFKK